MTRKDYVAIAQEINVALTRAQICRNDETYIHAGDLARGIAVVMKRDNEAFDSARFLAACGVQS